MENRDDFLAGDSPSDVGQSREQKEAQAGVFEAGQKRTVRAVPEDQREELRGVQGPGGDSRPDRTEPGDGGFVAIDDDPRMTTTRDPHDQPEVRKEDPQFLEEHRVDREDEIVARPSRGPIDGEIAEIQTPMIHGDESEEL